MELAHTNKCNNARLFCAEFIDKLDELKTNIDERQAIATSAAAALGRKTMRFFIQLWIQVLTHLKSMTLVQH